MYKKDFGQIILNLRKNKNMTQLQLAEQMNVTDKAVSKWERDLAYPDINTVPCLAEVLGVPVEDLLELEQELEDEEEPEDSKFVQDLKLVSSLIFKIIPLALGIAV